ncbi:Protein smoothened [Armadillidium vulgare]|nr:Protein smoothened [Armadillidium vulgare]
MKRIELHRPCIYTTPGTVENETTENLNTFVLTNVETHITEVPHSKLDAPKLSSRLYTSGKRNECWKEARCEPLEEHTCFGVNLPYTHTSLALSGLPSQRAAREALEYMTALKNLPHCWSVVQPFLCAILFPQCNESSTVSRDLHFNTTGQCSAPLISTSNENLWVDGIRGCAVQCADPMLTEEEHKMLQNFIAWFGGICLACSAVTVLTYMIDWKCARKYPALIIFYINFCFLVASIGFMVQFNSTAKEKITCNSDGTLLHPKPSSGEDWSCIVLFVCVYYFIIAAGMWFIILGYSLHRSFKSLAGGQCQENLERKAKNFHRISWSIPFIFTCFIIAFGEVKADSAVGICFLSPTVEVRVLALLIPISIIVCIGSVFLIKGLISLVKMKLECSNIISDNANKKIKRTIFRLGVFILAIVIFLIITIACHIYVFMNGKDWNKSLRNFILCSSKITSDSSECVMGNRPGVNFYILHLVALFGSGIAMSSWCWTLNSVKAWRRFLRRVANVGGDEPVRLTKHKVIAQAFAKKNDFNYAGRLSISLRSFHSDPLGLNFEMNSSTSCEVSSVFAAAIPYLMNRRGAVSGSSAFMFRRNSFDSEYSISRRVSLESTLNGRRRHLRRHSLDSQMSFHVSDIERVAAMQTAARFRRRRKKRDGFLSFRKGKKSSYDRRNSTSDDSNMGSMILPTLTLSTNDSLFTTMMKKFNLSSDDQSFTHLKKEEGQEFHITDSEDDTRENIETALPSFARKYNGFKHKCGNYSHVIKGNKNSNITKASVGVQTSLDSLVSCQPLTSDKSCQVSTPMLQRMATNQDTSTSSPSGSFTSLSESSKIKETSFMSDKSKIKSKSGSGNTLLPLSRSLKKTSCSGSMKPQKKRCFSENDKSHCVLDMEDTSND